MDTDMDTSTTMFTAAHTPSMIPCCLCSSPILPSASANNMCTTCLRSQTNITSNLPSTLSVAYCPDCSSFHSPPRQWTPAALESPTLLKLLLHRVIVPKQLNLAGAEFVWTEPHSKRIKVKLTVQAQLAAGTYIQQSHVVEFVVSDHLCDKCSRANANPDQWVAKVQLRQHVSHRRTFFYLEQLILKHRAADKAIRIQMSNLQVIKEIYLTEYESSIGEGDVLLCY